MPDPIHSELVAALIRNWERRREDLNVRPTAKAAWIDAQAADLIERLTSAPAGEVRREQYSDVDDETIRAFIDGWNARLDYTDFDLALHFWMLSQVTQIGTTELATAPSPSPVARVPDREELLRKLRVTFCLHVESDGLGLPAAWEAAFEDMASQMAALFTASPSDGSGEGK